MIRDKGNHREAFGSINAKINKGKGVMHSLGLFAEEDEYYQAIKGAPPQPPAKLVNLTKFESSEEVKILANRMAQLKFSLKEKSAIRS